MEAGLTATLELTVTEADTATALGSGDLPVLSTPRLLAWLEAATCAAVADRLPPGATTVGTRVEIAHRAASSVGATVAATATVARTDGRLIEYAVAARDAATGRVLADGTITRAVVDRQRFLGRVAD